MIEWLLEGPAWVGYRTRQDLLHQPESNPDVAAARRAMRQDPQVRQITDELAGWPVRVLTSHKSASHPLHKIVFTADLGLKISDPEMEGIVARILEHRSSQGPFQVLGNVPVHFGGRGIDIWGWALCDAPLLLYSLVRLGLGQDERVVAGVDFLAGLARENGWPCTLSPEGGKFRGPGRKEDPCPYATLIMLKLLAQMPAGRYRQVASQGVAALLEAWELRQTRHAYMFYMGTDFCKLKVPLVWYDIVHVLDVLTQYLEAIGDKRLEEMLDLVKSKMDAQGRFTPESIWTTWKDWEFAQKKQPSRWLTLVVQRILRRVETAC
ncbi:MAG: hypothetical protein M1281_01895 [Chloroflexi bacterium]|nr:hypothetical protein [Chloroflexota bacterium]